MSLSSLSPARKSGRLRRLAFSSPATETQPAAAVYRPSATSDAAWPVDVLPRDAADAYWLNQASLDGLLIGDFAADKCALDGDPYYIVRARRSDTRTGVHGSVGLNVRRAVRIDVNPTRSKHDQAEARRRLMKMQDQQFFAKLAYDTLFRLPPGDHVVWSNGARWEKAFMQYVVNTLIDQRFTPHLAVFASPLTCSARHDFTAPRRRHHAPHFVRTAQVMLNDIHDRLYQHQLGVVAPSARTASDAVATTATTATKPKTNGTNGANGTNGHDAAAANGSANVDQQTTAWKAEPTAMLQAALAAYTLAMEDAGGGRNVVVEGEQSRPTAAPTFISTALPPSVRQTARKQQAERRAEADRAERVRLQRLEADRVRREREQEAEQTRRERVLREERDRIARARLLRSLSLAFGYVSQYSDDALPLQEWARAYHSVDAWRSVLFQILYSITVLTQIGIRHNDLHGNNVIVSPTSVPRSLDGSGKPIAHYLYRVSDTLFFRVPIARRYVTIVDWDTGALDGVHFQRVTHDLRLPPDTTRRKALRQAVRDMATALPTSALAADVREPEKRESTTPSQPSSTWMPTLPAGVKGIGPALQLRRNVPALALHNTKLEQPGFHETFGMENRAHDKYDAHLVLCSLLYNAAKSKVYLLPAEVIQFLELALPDERYRGVTLESEQGGEIHCRLGAPLSALERNPADAAMPTPERLLMSPFFAPLRVNGGRPSARELRTLPLFGLVHVSLNPTTTTETRVPSTTAEFIAAETERAHRREQQQQQLARSMAFVAVPAQPPRPTVAVADPSLVSLPESTGELPIPPAELTVEPEASTKGELVLTQQEIAELEEMLARTSDLDDRPTAAGPQASAQHSPAYRAQLFSTPPPGQTPVSHANQPETVEDAIGTASLTAESLSFALGASPKGPTHKVPATGLLSTSSPTRPIDPFSLLFDPSHHHSSGRYFPEDDDTVGF